MQDSTPRERFLASLRRCQAQDRFLHSFYERFLASSDEVKEKFRGTDFARQTRLLGRTLELSAAATRGEPGARRELAERALSHDRRHLDIRPDLYAVWLDTLILTAREHDPEWTDDTEGAWRHILRFVIDYMARRY